MWGRKKHAERVKEREKLARLEAGMVLAYNELRELAPSHPLLSEADIGEHKLHGFGSGDYGGTDAERYESYTISLVFAKTALETEGIATPRAWRDPLKTYFKERSEAIGSWGLPEADL